MAETLSEFDGCDLLARLFRARGYTIKRNQFFREYGVEFHIDGWDAKARVGFEFLTSEDEDHDDLSLEEYKTLCDAQRRGELALFIIDEVEPLSEKELAAEAHEFLDEVAAVASARLRRGAKKPKAKPAVKKPAVKKPAVKKKAVKKKAARKKAKVAKKQSRRKRR
jgi:hypothetical protein